MLNSQKHKKKQFYRVLLLILLRKTRQRRGVTYDVIDELQRLSLSKCFPALCHKLIYEIAIFHSIKRETCDNSLYCTTSFIQKNMRDVIKNPVVENFWSCGLQFGISLTIFLKLPAKVFH